FIDQINPRQFLLREDVFGGREVLRSVKTAGGNIDFVSSRVPLISNGGSATVTESPPRSCIRAVSFRVSHLEFEIRTSNRNPRNRLGADSSPAISTVAVGLVNGLPGRSVAHLPTVTAAG